MLLLVTVVGSGLITQQAIGMLSSLFPLLRVPLMTRGIITVVTMLDVLNLTNTSMNLGKGLHFILRSL